eukprot:m.267494 g.267494  ORF g.267494 m.267494 type:complete len:55 (+) comp40514_c1_seq17:138-302(+)
MVRVKFSTLVLKRLSGAVYLTLCSELSSTGIAAVRLWFAFSALVWLSLSLSLKQ